jgi:hypothetical protein
MAGVTRSKKDRTFYVAADAAGEIEAYIDSSQGKPVNQAATRLAQSFGWQLSLVGPVVIVGLNQDTDPAALSPGQIDAILEKVRKPAA